jgi:hypothetical protein
MCRITCDLSVAQANPSVRPLNGLRITGGKDESRIVRAIELFHMRSHFPNKQSFKTS